MERDEKVVVVTAAMLSGTGIVKLQPKYPDRVLDVGIAEGHAVTCSAGLATTGNKPFVAIYSTFLQRALDHIIHDVAIQNLPKRTICDDCGSFDEFDWDDEEIDHQDMFVCLGCRFQQRNQDSA